MVERVSLRTESLDQRLAALKAKMQALAPAALARDKEALRKVEALEQEQAAIQRQATLEELAALEAKRQQAEAQAQAAREERKAREDAAAKYASEILYADDGIDALLIQLSRKMTERRDAIRALAETKIVSSYATLRMQSKFPLTAALNANNIQSVASVEHCLPAHRKTLSEQDAWLSKPLTAVEVPSAHDDDDEAEHTHQLNGGST